METTELSTTIQDTTKELIALANMPKNQIKKEMDANYLDMLVKANPNLKKEHFVEFITKCQISGADPRMNQIYLIVHDAWNSQTQTKEPKGTTVFSYQYFIRMAQQTGQLEDFEVDIIEEPYLDLMTGKRRLSLTAKAWVKRKGQGKLTYKARLWEFAKTTKDGVLMGNWKVSPYLMLEKCAIANVMRWAFPEALGNFYVMDEMEKATEQAPTPRKVENEIVQKRIGTTVETEIVQTKVEPIVSETPIVSDCGLTDEMTSDKSIEEYREELLFYIETTEIDWQTKINRTKDYMLDKVRDETDLLKMVNMYQYILKVK